MIFLESLGLNMEDIYKYILIPTMMSILFIVPSILLDARLAKIGVIRSNRTVVVIFVVSMVFLKPFIFKNWSWWVFGIALLVAEFAIHRSDLGETIKHGKWWWRSENKKGNRHKLK